MRIIPTGNPGEWTIEGIGTIRNQQGRYVVSVSRDTDISEEQWNQVNKFIEDEKISN
jgi:hypothetical protein